MNPTPTPIPIDGVPQEFKQYMFDFFTDIILRMKNIIIPFTSVSIFDITLGTIIVSAVTGAIWLMYGKGGDSKSHE